ncbi:MAG: hypothetical protein KH284_14595 [Clostridiales bacterium]|nr:hypothetical protein [Clostridiales bacterium]
MGKDWLDRTESISTISANFSVGVPFFAGIFFSSKVIKEEPSLIPLKDNWKSILLLFLIWIVFFVIFMLVYRKTKNHTQLAILNSTQECLRAFKAETHSMKLADPKNPLFFYAYMTEKAMNMCNHIEKAFRVSMNWNSSVCIKFVVDDKDPIKIATLCRSLGTPENRLKDTKNILASENTDFDLIIKGILPRFCTHNLKLTVSALLKKKIIYKNSSYEYLSRYNTVIVVPIGRSDSFYSDFQVIAFLCIDAPNTLNRTKFKSIEKMALSFAEGLYPFFDYCLRIQEMVDDRSK